MKTVLLKFVLPLLLLGLQATGTARAASDEVTWIADKQGCKVANTFPRAGETIAWDGTCKSGFADGEGVLQWFYKGVQDDRYAGTLEKGWAEGHGVLTRANGAKYDGQWHESVQQGNGRYEDPDGSWYEGEWKNGRPNGAGQYHRPDGRMFIGEFVNGEFEGNLNEKEKAGEGKPNPNRL